ncbi:hypothetical protein MNBD_GAMMA22-827 [hydrothermal vent metagenome]|uniref:Transmembrane protein n=1 Tax=hydrothermal vent metagenome TaxID=652676 RepID=A0A3B0ZW84_9ZZZZ
MNDSNPFQTPESDVSPTPANTANTNNKTIVCNTVAALNGANWVIDGFRNFAINPFSWLLVVFLYLLMLGTLSILPFISIISTIIAPIFMAGLMIIAKENKYNSSFSINNLFDGFRLNGGKLAGLGAIYFGMIILLFMVLGIIALVVLFGNIENIESFADPSNFTPNTALIFLLFILIALAVMIPIIMAFWFAPALVIFHDIEIFDAIKLSFTGCIKNVLPYLIYSLVYIVVYFVAIIPVALLAIFLDSNDPNPIIIILMILTGLSIALILTATFFTSVFASYEDIFSTEP